MMSGKSSFPMTCIPGPSLRCPFIRVSATTPRKIQSNHRRSRLPDSHSAAFVRPANSNPGLRALDVLSGRQRISNCRTPEQITASREKIAAKFSAPPSEIDSVTAIHEMERLGPQKPDDFSTLASHSFRMAGEQDQGGNSRRTTSRAAGRSRECSRNRTSWPTPCRSSDSNKAVTPTKRGALEEKLTF